MATQSLAMSDAGELRWYYHMTPLAGFRPAPFPRFRPYDHLLQTDDGVPRCTVCSETPC